MGMEMMMQKQMNMKAKKDVARSNIFAPSESD
jgi:hypothetical protein